MVSQSRSKQFDKIARELVRDSIIEKAAVRFVSQIIAETLSIRQPDAEYVCVKREKLEAIDDMITNCAGVPNNPDSLIRMVQYEIRSLLKEKGGENG
jgi:hypothetical protein